MDKIYLNTAHSFFELRLKSNDNSIGEWICDMCFDGVRMFYDVDYANYEVTVSLKNNGEPCFRIHKIKVLESFGLEEDFELQWWCEEDCYFESIFSLGSLDVKFLPERIIGKPIYVSLWETQE